MHRSKGTLPTRLAHLRGLSAARSGHSETAYHRMAWVAALANEGGFSVDNRMAGYRAEPTPEWSTDDACERRLVAERRLLRLGSCCLTTRQFAEQLFPDIATLLRQCRGISEAKVTADDASGNLSFERFCKRASTRVVKKIGAAVCLHPALLYAFDTIADGGTDLPTRHSFAET